MGMQRTSAVLRHLGDADLFMRACQRCGDYGLAKYAPAAMLAVSSIVAGHERCGWRAGGRW